MKEFRTEENRTHARRARVKRDRPVRFPLTEYLEEFTPNEGVPFFADKTPLPGRLSDLSVDIGQLKGKGSIRLRLYYPSKEGEGEEKVIRAKGGANNLGSFDLLANARIELYFLPEEESEVLLKRVYIAGTFIHE